MAGERTDGGREPVGDKGASRRRENSKQERAADNIVV